MVAADEQGQRTWGQGVRQKRHLLPGAIAVAVAVAALGSVRSFVEAPRGLNPSDRQRTVRPTSLAAASSPGFFPGNPSMAPSAQTTFAPEASQVNAEALVAENRMLREDLKSLIEEIRLLRTSLLQGSDASPAAAAAPQVAPAPAARASPVQQAQSSFPTAPAPAPMPSTFPLPTPPAQRQMTPSEVVGEGQATAKIVSSGYERGNLGDFVIDGQRVQITEAEAQRRGLNVVAIDPTSNRVIWARAYDVWGSPYRENQLFSLDIGDLPDGHVVLVALKDSGMENIDANTIRALQSIGSTVSAPLAMREAYALIGVKGGVAIGERRGAEVEIEGVLPCKVQRLMSMAPLPQAREVAPAPGGSQSPFLGANPPFGGNPPAGGQAPMSGTVTDAQVAPPSPAAPSMAFNNQGQVAPTSPPPPTMSSNPQGQVSAVNEVSKELEGENWEQVLVMLDKLQDKIQARRQQR